MAYRCGSGKAQRYSMDANPSRAPRGHVRPIATRGAIARSDAGEGATRSVQIFTIAYAWLIAKCRGRAGQAVKVGQTLAVVEAMKMENVLRAERDQVVSLVCANAGDSLAVDQAILEFE